jgi:hypothetical protein
MLLLMLLAWNVGTLRRGSHTLQSNAEGCRSMGCAEATAQAHVCLLRWWLYCLLQLRKTVLCEPY